MSESNSEVHVVHLLPVSDSGCGDIRVTANSADLEIAYEFYSKDTEENCVGIIRFQDIAAFRFFDEMHSFHFIDESYDAVIEISRSTWKAELSRDEASRLAVSASEKKHFAVFFTNNGYFEVIARELETPAVRKGDLCK